MKKIAAVFGVIIATLILIDRSQFYICSSYQCREVSDAILLNFLIVSGISFLILCILYFFPRRMYSRWWKFARKVIPVILIISTIINLQLHHNSNSFFNMDNMFDLPILISMYVIFVVGSLLQIWKGYKNR